MAISARRLCLSRDSFPHLNGYEACAVLESQPTPRWADESLVLACQRRMRGPRGSSRAVWAWALEAADSDLFARVRPRNACRSKTSRSRFQTARARLVSSTKPRKPATAKIHAQSPGQRPAAIRKRPRSPSPAAKERYDARRLRQRLSAFCMPRASNRDRKEVRRNFERFSKGRADCLPSEGRIPACSQSINVTCDLTPRETAAGVVERSI